MDLEHLGRVESSPTMPAFEPTLPPLLEAHLHDGRTCYVVPKGDAARYAFVLMASDGQIVERQTVQSYGAAGGLVETVMGAPGFISKELGGTGGFHIWDLVIEGGGNRGD